MQEPRRRGFDEPLSKELTGNWKSQAHFSTEFLTPEKHFLSTQVGVPPKLFFSVRQVVLCETEIVVPVFTTGGCKKRFCHLHFIFLVLQAFQAFRSTKCNYRDQYLFAYINKRIITQRHILRVVQYFQQCYSPFFRFLIFFCLVRLVPGCNIRLDEEVTLPPLLICALKVFL